MIFRLALALVLALTVTGCQSDSTSGTDWADAFEGAEVRTDRDPIATRFPWLGSFTDVHWVGGRLGNDRVPGPSDFLIEAVVTLVPADVDRLRGEYEFVPMPANPRVPQSLVPFVGGSGPWYTSAELNALEGNWWADVYLRPDAGVVYVSASTH